MNSAEILRTDIGIESIMQVDFEEFISLRAEEREGITNM